MATQREQRERDPLRDPPPADPAARGAGLARRALRQRGQPRAAAAGPVDLVVRPVRSRLVRRRGVGRAQLGEAVALGLAPRQEARAAAVDLVVGGLLVGHPGWVWWQPPCRRPAPVRAASSASTSAAPSSSRASSAPIWTCATGSAGRRSGSISAAHGDDRRGRRGGARGGRRGDRGGRLRHPGDARPAHRHGGLLDPPPARERAVRRRDVRAARAPGRGRQRRQLRGPRRGAPRRRRRVGRRGHAHARHGHRRRARAGRASCSAAGSARAPSSATWSSTWTARPARGTARTAGASR